MEKKIKLSPNEGNIFVEYEEYKKTKSGIIMKTESKGTEVMVSKIVATADDIKHPDYKTGCYVAHMPFVAPPIIIEGQKIMILRKEHLIGSYGENKPA